MEIRCPLCQNQLTIDDQFAGQVLECKMCSGKFQAPVLPDAPPPVSPPATFGLQDPPAAPKAVPSPDASSMPASKASAAAQSETPASSTPLPPLADGFNHIYFLSFNQRIISWVAVVCLALIFVLSFFPWTTSTTISKVKEDSDLPPRLIIETASMWTTSVTTFIFYAILFFFTLVFAVLAMLVDKKIISLPDPLKKMRRWRSLAVAGFGGLGWFVLLIHWASTLNFYVANPNTVVFSVVLLLQKLVFVGPLLEYWLQQRKKEDLPVPKIEMRW